MEAGFVSPPRYLSIVSIVTKFYPSTSITLFCITFIFFQQQYQISPSFLLFQKCEMLTLICIFLVQMLLSCASISYAFFTLRKPHKPVVVTQFVSSIQNKNLPYLPKSQEIFHSLSWPQLSENFEKKKIIIGPGALPLPLPVFPSSCFPSHTLI